MITLFVMPWIQCTFTFMYIHVNWSKYFLDYYMNEIHPDTNNIGRWILEPLGLYNPYSKRYNTVMKRLDK